MLSRSNALLARTALLGGAGGLLLAIVTSAGIAAERVCPGSSAVMITANLVSAIAAVLLLTATLPSFGVAFEAPPSVVGVSMTRARRRLAMASQAAGGAVAVFAVHWMLESQLRTHPWLREQWPQLVNDGVAVLGALALVWAAAERGRGRFATLAAVAIAIAYVVTAPKWHLDASPIGARAAIGPVQLGVVGRLAVIAALTSALRRGFGGAGAIRALWRDERRGAGPASASPYRRVDADDDRGR